MKKVSIESFIGKPVVFQDQSGYFNLGKVNSTDSKQGIVVVSSGKASRLVYKNDLVAVGDTREWDYLQFGNILLPGGQMIHQPTGTTH